MQTTNETNSETTKVKKSNKSKLIIGGVLLAVIIILAAGVAWLYTGTISSAKLKVFTTLPLPAAIVQTHSISSTELFRRIDLAKKIIADNNLKENELEDQILKQLVDSQKLEIIAGNNKITVSPEDLNAEFDNVLKQSGKASEEELSAELMKIYGIDLATFKNDVLRQTILQNNLSVWFNSQEQLNSGAYSTARDLLNKLDSGASFDDVAKGYTQDEASKDFAGDSGFVLYDAMLPEFKKAVSEMSINDNRLVTSRYGVHILKVKAIQDGENGAGKSYHLQQIFVKPADFQAWLTTELGNIRSVTLL